VAIPCPTLAAELTPSERSALPRSSLLLTEGLRQALTLCGVDLEQLRRSVAGLADLDQEGFWASESGIHAIATVLSQTPEGPAFGLRWARMLPAGANGIVPHLWRSADTLRHALDLRARFTTLLFDFVRLDVLVAGERALLRLTPPGPSPLHPLIENYRLTRGLFMLRDMLADAEFTPCEVHFTQTEPRTRTPYFEIFGPRTALRFDRARTQLCFPTELLDATLPGRDPLLNGVLQRYAEQALSELPRADKFASRVEELVATMLHEGRPTLSAVAKRLHIGERTLRRRLTDEGTTFFELLDRVRASLAELYRCEPGLKAEGLAARLGFESGSALRRASRRWQQGRSAPFSG
jgi:AraC-like DNA-binding protein